MTLRSLVHASLAVIILSLYGGRVCPFLESLGPLTLMRELLVAFTIALALRQWLADRFVDRLPGTKRPAGQFRLEMGLYLAIGVCVTLFNHFHYGFPLGSGLKLLLGLTTLGLFAAVDLALARERIAAGSAGPGEPGGTEAGFFSITRKFAIFTSVITVLVAAVFILVIFKDLAWIIEVRPISPEQAKMAVMKEILFMAAVFFAHIFNLILSYSRNLKLSVSEENRVLMAVAEGDLATQVRTVTNDEFAIMARYTNLMIHQLAQNKTRLEEAQRKLMDAERLRAIGEFASSIVHEIRSPLNVVQMVLEYFERRELGEGERKRLDLAGQEVARLGGLMNEILLYAKPQELKRVRLDLAAALRDWHDTLEAMPACRERRLELLLSAEPLWTRADADKLKQVMLNLVGNACEAVAAGETVRVSLERQDAELHIAVHNGGDPIPAERLERLTEPFFTTRAGGTGLGLPIVLRIVAAHGGSFGITSSAQEGTRAEVRLPLVGDTDQPEQT